MQIDANHCIFFLDLKLLRHPVYSSALPVANTSNISSLWDAERVGAYYFEAQNATQSYFKVEC